MPHGQKTDLTSVILVLVLIGSIVLIGALLLVA
jgi:hypothetical protein